MRLNRFDYTVWTVLAVLAAALAGTLWIGDQIGARIQATYPAPGDSVGAYSRVGLTFAQPMQVLSAEAAFQISPPVSGTLEWENNTVWFRPLQPFQSAVTYTARLAAGAVSLGGQVTPRPITWTFQIREPWIAYVSTVNGPREVWRIRPDGTAAEQLTQTQGQVYDLAVSRDGDTLAYSVLNAQKGFDLWIMPLATREARQLLNCGPDRCATPAWAPDGRTLAYSRENTGVTPTAPKGPPRLWTVDLTSNSTTQTYTDSQILGYGPSWSPDGQRLAVFDGGTSVLRLLEWRTGQEMLLPTAMGMMGSWSPDGQHMLYTDLNLGGSSPFASVLRADLDTRTITPVLGQDVNPADYGPPEWSPLGDWVAISQRVAGAGPGKQIWLFHPDGTDPRPVTTNPNFTQGGYHWDAWGTHLVYQRFEMNKAYAVPEVVVWDAASQTETVLVPDASLPLWMP